MIDQDFTRMDCGKCGIVHYIPTSLYRENKQLGDKGPGWHCPNGHPRIFRDNETDTLRRERDRLKQQLACERDRTQHQKDRAKSAEKSKSAFKGQVTRLRNRAKNGVCPCCNRSFQNLARHMHSKHPNFDPTPSI